MHERELEEAERWDIKNSAVAISTQFEPFMRFGFRKNYLRFNTFFVRKHNVPMYQTSKWIG